MSNGKWKYEYLPKLQRKIVLTLAKQEEPKTITEINRQIRGEYTSTHRAFHLLEAKGIIQKVSVKPYRGREFPRYWLTVEGVFLAFVEGAEANVLLKTAKQMYPNNTGLHAFLDFCSVFDHEVWRTAFEAIKGKGKIEPVDLATVMVRQLGSKLTLEKLREALTLLKKYPETLESFMTFMQGLGKLFQLASEGIC